MWSSNTPIPKPTVHEHVISKSLIFIEAGFFGHSIHIWSSTMQSVSQTQIYFKSKSRSIISIIECIETHWWIEH